MWTKFNIKTETKYFKKSQIYIRIKTNENKLKLKKKPNIISNVSYIIKIKKLAMNEIF